MRYLVAHIESEMGETMLRVYIRSFIALILFLTSTQSWALLISTDLGIQVGVQATPTSAFQSCTFLSTATVVEPGVEFPSLGSLGSSCSGLSTVNVSVNAGDKYLDIGFNNAGSGSYAAGYYFNGYVFTFDSAAAIQLTSASVDQTVTNLGITDSSLGFSGNQLTVNVVGLPFNSSTYARILLDGYVVPIPASIWLFGSGLLGFVGITRRKKAG